MVKLLEKKEPEVFRLEDIEKDENGVHILETTAQERKRRFSRWVIYFSMFIQSLGFSIVLTGVWPYLKRLENNPNKEWLGWIVAANPVGQLVASPIIGWWCNYNGSIRIPTIFTLFMFIGGNIWYGLLPVHSSGATYFFILARFLVGVSSGGIASNKTYLAAGTTVGERTRAISHLSLFQALGFILGPAVQVALTPLGKDGVWHVGRWSLSMYTSPGWVAAFFGVANLFMFMSPNLFIDSNIAAKEAYIAGQLKMQRGEATKAVDWSKIKPDYVGLVPVLLAFFIVVLNFVLLETLATPVAMEQFAWSAETAIRNVGFTTIVSSIITMGCFFLIARLTVRFGERQVLILLGFIPMVVGRIFFLPIFGGEPAKMLSTECINETDTFLINWPPGVYKEFMDQTIEQDTCEDIDGLEWKVHQEGCPADQEWCFEINALNPIIVAVGYLFATIGYPFCMAILQAIFSKMIGPRPQGVWMGLLTSVSSVSRIVGPILVSYIYTGFGTFATFGSVIGLTAFGGVILIVFYKRMVPLVLPVSDITPPSPIESKFKSDTMNGDVVEQSDQTKL